MDITASVIIPVYNAETTLRKCVESLVYGKIRNVEVILVEDCSDDGSAKLCQQLKSEYDQIVYIRHSVNKGVSAARNAGLKEATGKWIFFVDSDDWVSGDYVNKMVECAEKCDRWMPVCAYVFIDYTISRRYIYQYSKPGAEGTEVYRNCLFSLYEKVMLQQLWNKAFLRDVIVQNGIEFDEKIKMGEDFQFVLDYMKAADIEKCSIINQPLYYYTRTGSSSLMGKYFLDDYSMGLQRLKQLKEYCGNHKGVQDSYTSAVQTWKNMYVYQVARSKRKTKDKQVMIESVMGDGQSLKYYTDQKILIRKEQLAEKKNQTGAVLSRIKNRVHREKVKKTVKTMRADFLGKDFTIISQNCIGGVLYHDMGLPFNTPTINLFFKSTDFIRFVKNLKYYLNCPLRMTWGEEYPVGYLDDIAVFFMHYKTCSEAEHLWKKRCERIDMERVLVLCTDREGFDDSDYRQWLTISYPKILFTATKREDDNAIYFPEYKAQGEVADLIPDRLFYKDHKVIDIINKHYSQSSLMSESQL